MLTLLSFAALAAVSSALVAPTPTRKPLEARASSSPAPTALTTTVPFDATEVYVNGGTSVEYCNGQLTVLGQTVSTTVSASMPAATNIHYPKLACPSSIVYTAALPNSTAGVDAACQNGDNPGSNCYSQLNLDYYTTLWWAINEAACGKQGFAECWYSLKTPYAPSTCDQLNVDPACTQPRWSDFENTGPTAAHDFYVSWTIWNTQGLFLDLYTAIGGANGLISDAISSIVTLLDPPQPPNPIEYVLDALSFALSLYAEGSVLVKALIRTAPQTTTLMGKVFPSGSVDSQFSTWSEVAANIGTVTTILQNSVASGLPDVVDNITTFNLLNTQSGLSGIRPSLSSLQDSMVTAVGTYAISDILSTLSLAASRGANTDVNALQTNGTKLEWNTGCGSGYDSLGICNEWYYDGHDSFSLSNPNDLTDSYHDKLEFFFNGTNPLSSGKLLFSDAYSCAQQTGHNGGNKPSLDPTDPTNIACLSVLQICTWDIYTTNPYSDCPRSVLTRYGISGCIGPTGDYAIDVPKQYLGGGILQSSPGQWSYMGICDNVDV